jgi:hypothetical protein
MCALSARGRTFSRRPDVTLEDGLQTVVCFFEDFLEIPCVRHFVHAVIDGWASLRGGIEDLTPLAILSPNRRLCFPTCRWQPPSFPNHALGLPEPTRRPYSDISEGHTHCAGFYALETDWPVGAAGFEPLHLEIRSAGLHPASTGI